MTAYYNEFDPYAAQWLRNLIDAGLIAPGVVDERSIEDVRPDELAEFTQCHFFAGIGGWSYALRLAGWPDDQPVWTGSCPCQPFSVAGKGAGFEDERHLWPAWQHLIQQCRPRVIFGEQVASATQWLGLVLGDLEAMGYAVAARPVEAASADADHFRDRYWIVADADGERKLQPQGFVKNKRRWACDQSPRPVVDLASLGWGEGWTEHEFRSRGFTAAVASVGGRQYVECPDGKWRALPPPRVRWLGNGLSAAMDQLRSIEERAIEEIERYGSTCKANANEVLQMVRKAIREEANRKEQSARMRLQFPAPQVLLDFLLCIESACASKNGRCVQKNLNESQLRVLRIMRTRDRDCRSPHRCESAKQQAGEPTDALHALSLILARHAETHRAATRDANAADNRISILRALGNAIDPRPATAFIRAYLEARQELRAAA